MNLTICLSYYENPAMLREQQRVIDTYPYALKVGLRLIIADDGSTESPAHEAAEHVFGYTLEVYRILKHRPWGQKGARNLATWHAPEGWMLVTDIDHVLYPDAAEALARRTLDPCCYYIPARRKPDGKPHRAHPNTYILTRHMFWDRVGGTNEDLDGYYGSDGPFRARIETLARRVELHDVPLTVYNLAGEDIGGVPGAATRDYGRKGTSYHLKSNPELQQRIYAKRLERPVNPLRREWERVL